MPALEVSHLRRSQARLGPYEILSAIGAGGMGAHRLVAREWVLFVPVLRHSIFQPRAVQALVIRLRDENAEVINIQHVTDGVRHTLGKVQRLLLKPFERHGMVVDDVFDAVLAMLQSANDSCSGRRIINALMALGNSRRSVGRALVLGVSSAVLVAEGGDRRGRARLFHRACDGPSVTTARHGGTSKSVRFHHHW